MESAEITSPPSRRASRTANAVLPDAVAPMITGKRTESFLELDIGGIGFRLLSVGPQDRGENENEYANADA